MRTERIQVRVTQQSEGWYRRGLRARALIARAERLKYGDAVGWLRFPRRRAGTDGASADDLELALEEPVGHVDALFDAAARATDPRYAYVSDRLEAWSPRLWLRLDAARLDAWSWDVGELAPERPWRRIVADGGCPVLLLVLASTHRDGFLREAATRALALRDERLAAAALAVRAFDHVPQVRDAARAALLSRSPERDASIVLPILYAAQIRKTAGDLFDRYVARTPPETARELVASPDRETRRFAVQRAPLSVSELVGIAASDRDTHVRLNAARRALAEEPGVATELLELRPASVRALALADAAGSVVLPHLDQLLLDRSALLRRAAQARALASGYDLRSEYRESLPQRTAVLGLGEIGEPADAELLAALVGGAHAPAVRRAAVVGLGRLASAELLRELLPKLIYDDEPAVAREAGRQLRRIRFILHGSDLDRALGAPHVWTRQAALGMALAVRGWNAPVATLALYDDDDESLREYARATLRDWLERRAATAGTPSTEEVARLEASLDLLSLDEHLVRRLRFHAGIRG